MDGERLAEIIKARGSNHVAALLSEHQADHTEQAALEWLKHWGPTGLTPKPPTCTCAGGNCRICN
jgi:hypothetical protein